MNGGADQVDMDASGAVIGKVEGVSDYVAVAAVLVFAVIEIAGSRRELIEIRVFDCVTLDEGSNGALNLSI